MKITWIIIGLIYLTMVGCAGTGSISTYDKSKKLVVVQSTSDYRTAMPPLSNDADVLSVIEDLKQEIKDNPSNSRSYLNLAQLYLAAKQYKQAEATVRRALRIDLNNRLAKKILAQIYLRKGHHDMAVIILNGMGGGASRDSEVLNMLAMVALSERRNSEAMSFFKRGLELNPNNVAIRMNLGVLHVEYRQLQQASTQFERVLKIMPEHNDAKLHLAIIKATKGQFKEAEDLYETILARNSSNPLALFNFAVLDTKRRDYEAAVDHLNQYLDSKYARRTGNEDVYALMEEITSRRRSESGRVSDEEIHALAAKVRSRDRNQPENTQVAKEVIQPEEAPVTPESSHLNETIEDDIESLERELEQ